MLNLVQKPIFSSEDLFLVLASFEQRLQLVGNEKTYTHKVLKYSLMYTSNNISTITAFLPSSPLPITPSSFFAQCIINFSKVCANNSFKSVSRPPQLYLPLYKPSANRKPFRHMRIISTNKPNPSPFPHTSFNRLARWITRGGGGLALNA